MSDAEQGPESEGPAPAYPVGVPKRRARRRRGHTVGKVLLTSLVTVAMVTGLAVVFIYRDLNTNLNAVDLTRFLGPSRPAKPVVEGPQEPLNVLVMGSDSRDCDGCNLDNLTGTGGRSDTTILIHLSADRKRAYGISIPRDTLVDRPTCTDSDGSDIPGGSLQMWNAAYALGGPACTIRQFESITGIRIDHYVVVNFAGFRGMVDAIGGVEMCIPEDIDDRRHGIFIPAGTRKLVGRQALSYVRERYAVGNGSDIGRMKRQQAFIASMAHQVISAGTLANPIKVVGFLEAATKSLTLDPELGSLKQLGNLGYQFRNIGLNKIKFISIPTTGDPANPNRLIFTEDAPLVWQKILADKPLSKKLATGAIVASNLPGSKTGGGQPSGGSTSSPGTSDPTDEEQKAALEAAGLCV